MHSVIVRCHSPPPTTTTILMISLTFVITIGKSESDGECSDTRRLPRTPPSVHRICHVRPTPGPLERCLQFPSSIPSVPSVPSAPLRPPRPAHPTTPSATPPILAGMPPARPRLPMTVRFKPDDLIPYAPCTRGKHDG